MVVLFNLRTANFGNTFAGETIVEKDRCGQCKGQKVVQDKKLLEVHVEKGMQHGQKITFQGEADEAVRFPEQPRQ